MAAYGFGDHPRLSAVHKPDGKEVNNWHLHIVVSRIDSTTLKAENPRYGYFVLQAEAAKLEIELGLRQERKTLLSRERQEIEAMCGRQPEHEPPTPTPAAPAKRRSPSASSRRKLFGSERLQRDGASPSTTGRISG